MAEATTVPESEGDQRRRGGRVSGVEEGEVDEEVDGHQRRQGTRKNSPSMTIALPPLVPMSMPRYRGAGFIVEAKSATDRLAGCELGFKGFGAIAVNVVNALVFFFFAPRTSVPRLALPEEQRWRGDLVPEASAQPNCNGDRAAAAAASGMRERARKGKVVVKKLGKVSL